jgi:uncharacterized protein (DUF1330 family)
MALKLLVLYPHPTDAKAFEANYLSQHVPTMTKGAEHFKVDTYRTITTPPPMTADGTPAFHRVAIIEFRDMEHVKAFMQSEQMKIAFGSALKISTGGTPTLALLQPDV